MKTRVANTFSKVLIQARRTCSKRRRPAERIWQGAGLFFRDYFGKSSARGACTTPKPNGTAQECSAQATRDSARGLCANQIGRSKNQARKPSAAANSFRAQTGSSSCVHGAVFWKALLISHDWLQADAPRDSVSVGPVLLLSVPQSVSATRCSLLRSGQIKAFEAGFHTCAVLIFGLRGDQTRER